MKKTFILDKSEDDIIGLDENTIIKDTGIDAAKVKESVMMEIRNKKTTKKKMSVKKFLSIAAIAAVIAAAATVTVQAAAGEFNAAFGELFAGQPAGGIYPGADISVNSDELNIEFVGVTGSETEMLSVYNITKKDGSSFSEHGSENYELGNCAEVNISECAAKKLRMMFDGSRGYGSGVHYEFIDNKTIRATASYFDTLGYIKGERMTVSETEATFGYTNEVLYEDSSDVYMGCTRFMDDNKELIAQKEATLKEDQIITCILNDGHAQLVVATLTKLPLKYELGAKLNYKTGVREMPSAKGKSFHALNTDWTVANLKADSFSITLEAETTKNNIYAGFDLDEQENWSSEILDDYLNVSTMITLEITKVDGTKLYAVAQNYQSNTEADGNGRTTWFCNYCEDESASKPYAMDASEIESIKINGTELFG